jgi:hypothetical protein
VSTKGWVIVVPARGDVADTARALLSVATSVHDVRSQRGGREFLVAPYVADLFGKSEEQPKRPRTRRSKEGA